MGKKALQEFIERKSKSEPEISKIDWQKEKKIWLEYLDSFYQKAEEWLKTHIEKGAIAITYQDIDMNEDKIGQYSARKMRLKIGNDEVVLEPIGRFIIGAKGRIDMSGKNGKVTFVLTDKNAEEVCLKAHRLNDQQNLSTDLRWKIAMSPPWISYMVLNEDSFSDALLEVING